MTFQIIISDEVKKIIRNATKSYQELVTKKLDALADFPHFLDIKKIKGRTNIFRLRIGDYRAIFEVDYEEKTIYVKAFDTRQRIEKHY